MPGTLPAPLTGILGPLGTLRAAAAAAGVTDSFNRADSSTSLGTADSGQVWTVHSGTWGIDTNRARKFTVGDYQNASINSLLADCLVSYHVAAFFTADPGFDGLCCRLTDDMNFVRLIFAETFFRIASREAGGFVTYLTGSWPASPAAVGHLIAVRLEGDQVTVFQNGVSAGSATVSFNQTATRHGLHAYYGSPCWDDFSVSPL